MIFKETGHPLRTRNWEFGVSHGQYHTAFYPPRDSAATGPERRRQVDVAFISYLELQRLSFLSIDEKTVAVVCLLVQPLTAQDISESQDCLSEVGNRSY